VIEPQLLDLYRQRAGRIEDLHADGRINGAERRDLLLSLSQGLGIRPRAEQPLNALIRSVQNAERLDARRANRSAEYRARKAADRDATTNTSAA